VQTRARRGGCQWRARGRGSTRSLAPNGTAGSTTRWFDGSGWCILAKRLEAGRPDDFTELEDAAADHALLDAGRAAAPETRQQAAVVLLDLERAAVPRAGRESARRGSTADSFSLSAL